jgi:hypothetical protein
MRYAWRRRGTSPRLLVALERRVVFTLTDTAPRAPAYDYWRTLFREVPRLSKRATAGSVPAAAAQHGSVGAGGAAPPLPLLGWRLDAAAVPQYIPQYDRSEYLELWELTLADGTVTGVVCGACGMKQRVGSMHRSCSRGSVRLSRGGRRSR